MPSLIDELKAVLAGLEHARRALREDGLPETDGLWPRLERCASRLKTLDGQECHDIRPILLALLDELERTIATFGVEHRHLRDKLKSTRRSMAADAAYRQTTVR